MKTKAEMDARLEQLRGERAKGALTLRTAGELDAIQNHGLDGWNGWLKKKGAKQS